MRIVYSSNFLVMDSSQDNVKRVVDQLRVDINNIALEAKHLKNGQRLSKLQKMHDLQQIVSSLEDIDNSLNELLQKSKKPVTY